ncbi:MAG: LTA synthase family protein, partial [Chitinophagaceae bacterium]
FLIFQFHELGGKDFSILILSFYYAIPIDISSACYSMAFPFIVLWAGYLWNKKFWLKILQTVVVIIIFTQCAIAYGDAALYTQWHTKLNWKALAHFSHFTEPFRSSPLELTILVFSLTIILGLFFTFSYNRLVHIHSFKPSPSFLKRIFPGIVGFPVIGFLIFTGIRGGWQRFPISLSIAYYSPHSVLNAAAVNPSWFLIHDITQEALDVNQNPYHYMPPSEARQIVDSLYSYNKDTTVSFLTTTRPDIMVFILENVSFDAVSANVNPPIAPFFDSLSKQGIYFDNCYAIGFVSDEGIPGILSAFPTSGDVSILTEPQKTIHLPSINEVLDSVGYHSGFIYGGMLDFGNIQSYVYNKKFNLVKSDRDFPAILHRGALGIPDGIMAKYAADLVNESKRPFFYCWYTLSTHPPYDIPVPKYIQYGGAQMAYMNTLHYSDSSLRIFFERVEDKPWFKNTLFVFVPDHSHDSQYGRPSQSALRNKIPLLFYGNVIKPEWRGKVVSRVVSQLDITATLLAQMQLSYS